MFANFIYFIVALLIYATYQPTGAARMPLADGVGMLLLVFTGFALLVRWQFTRLARLAQWEDPYRLEARFNAAQSRMAILAIAVFAFLVYGLGLPSYVADWPVFAALPTLLAVVFMGLFAGLLAIVWHFSSPLFHLMTGIEKDRAGYVWSNLSFAIPVLLPWFMLSLLADVIALLPYQTIKAALNSTAGELSTFTLVLLLAAIYGPAIIQHFWRCRPMEEGPLRKRIAGMCARADVGYRDIVYWPIFGGSMMTAGVMGLVARYRYIMVTPALARALDPEELDAVIAHEIGHVRKHHLLFYLLFFLGYAVLAYSLVDLLLFGLIYFDAVSAIVRVTGFNPASTLSGIFNVALIGFFLIYFRYIFGYFMRNFERQADLHVFTLLPDAFPLIRSLAKIGMTGKQSPERPNWHHFNIRQRIDYLFRSQSDPEWIHRHDRKIHRGIVVYTLVMILVGGAGYAMNVGGSGSRFNRHFTEKLIVRELGRHPANADLYAMLGDLRQQEGRYAEAVDAYERAISLSSTDARPLNNLAWLYATCPDAAFRKPQRALTLARRAAALSRKPFVLDTLAESLYVNGEIDDAVAAEEAALAARPGNPSYYRKQLEKFKQGKKN